MAHDPAADPAFATLLDRWRGDHLGPEPTQGRGLLWKEGGIVELLVALHEAAPTTMAALAERLMQLDPEDALLRDFLDAWTRPSRAERAEALDRLDLYPPHGTLDDAFDALRPRMRPLFRQRLLAWIDLARGIEARLTALPEVLPLDDDLRRDLVRLREHLGLKGPTQLSRREVEQVTHELGCPVPIPVLAVLAALEHPARRMTGLLQEIEEYYEAQEQPRWRARAEFDHVPFLAAGEWPRTYACFGRAAPQAIQDFDLKTSTVDPPIPLELLLRRRWPNVPWDRPVAESALAALVATVSDPAPSGTVAHAKFGRGAVVEDKGDRAVVRFEDGVTRTMLWKFLETLA